MTPRSSEMTCSEELYRLTFSLNSNLFSYCVVCYSRKVRCEVYLLGCLECITRLCVCVCECPRYISNPDFDPSLVKNASNACEGLCKWVRALDVYDRVIKVVAPKKLKLADAEAELATQMKKLNAKRKQLKDVSFRLHILYMSA